MSKKAAVILSAAAFLIGIAGAQEAGEASANKAARIRILASRSETSLAGREAPEGKVYLLLQTEWENIHPKQKTTKSELEKKKDRTMGVGALRGEKKKKEEKDEVIELDVPYLVPNLFDHLYCLADGQSFPLDSLTGEIPGGADPHGELAIGKFGEKKTVELVYLVPAEAGNLAFQLFDYAYGHILIPISGDIKLARGAGRAPGKALGSIKDSSLELSATKMDFRTEFEGEEAREGWQYAIVNIAGKSLSGSGAVKNIVQIEPTEYIWLQTEDGYLYYCQGATTTEDGFVRFTPEVFQNQELRFLVPAADKNFALGLRVGNTVYALNLSPSFTPRAPAATVVHRDGKTMEIMLFGARREEGRLILDLGIKSLVGSGIEIQTAPQFILEAGGEKVEFDESATAELVRRPPEPFTIPPRTFVRFELAYEVEAVPAALHYRGYESEGKLALPDIK
jgi:hypothetical protein